MKEIVVGAREIFMHKEMRKSKPNKVAYGQTKGSVAFSPTKTVNEYLNFQTYPTIFSFILCESPVK